MARHPGKLSPSTFENESAPTQIARAIRMDFRAMCVEGGNQPVTRNELAIQAAFSLIASAPFVVSNLIS